MSKDDGTKHADPDPESTTISYEASAFVLRFSNVKFGTIGIGLSFINLDVPTSNAFDPSQALQIETNNGILQRGYIGKEVQRNGASAVFNPNDFHGITQNTLSQDITGGIVTIPNATILTTLTSGHTFKPDVLILNGSAQIDHLHVDPMQKPPVIIHNYHYELIFQGCRYYDPAVDEPDTSVSVLALRCDDFEVSSKVEQTLHVNLVFTGGHNIEFDGKLLNVSPISEHDHVSLALSGETPDLF